MKKSQTLTRRQQIEKTKIKHYNQLRNLFMKQFKEYAKFYEQDAADALENKRRQKNATHVHTDTTTTNTPLS